MIVGVTFVRCTVFRMFIFFWGCFILGLCLAILAILCQNTVYSILVLILLFITAAILLFLLNVEFLGFIFIIVYVGAIAVLFLFVVMLLNIRVQEVHTSVMRYWPWGGFVGLSCLALLLFVFSFDLPLGTFGTALSRAGFAHVFENFEHLFLVMAQAFFFSISDFFASLPELSVHKLFYVSFLSVLQGFVCDYIYAGLVVNGFWFFFCSLGWALKDALTVTEVTQLLQVQLSWVGQTPYQFSYFVFFMLCVREFFLSFYVAVFIQCASVVFPSWLTTVLPHYLDYQSYQGFRFVVTHLISDLWHPAFSSEAGLYTANAPRLFVLQQQVALLPLELLTKAHPSEVVLFKTSWLSFIFDVDTLTLLGRALYEPFAAYFIIAGLVLFVALIGALVLTYQQDNTRKRFYLLRQVNADTKRLLLRIPPVVGSSSSYKQPKL